MGKGFTVNNYEREKCGFSIALHELFVFKFHFFENENNPNVTNDANGSKLLEYLQNVHI